MPSGANGPGRKNNGGVRPAEIFEEEDWSGGDLNRLAGALASMTKDRLGTFAVGQKASGLPALPGLKIDGELVPLPVVDPATIIAKATLAPFGQGEDTVVDRTVRDTWQLEPERVTFENPQWHAGLKEIVREVAVGLGADPNNVEANLYKILLYQKGGHFAKHRDTEKEETMFGTLSVTLPSEFDGGTLIARFHGDAKEFPFPVSTKYECFYAAHYADVEHEVQPIEAGVRLAAVYSLCWKGRKETMPAPDIADQKNRALRAAADELFSQSDVAVFQLAHQYTERSFETRGCDALKGTDAKVMEALRVAVDGVSFRVALVEQRATENGSGYEDDGYGGGFFDPCGDTDIEETTVTAWYTSDGDDDGLRFGFEGNLEDNNGEFDGDFLDVATMRADRGRLNWGDAVDVGHVSYTGNEGASREVTYARALLVAFPDNVRRKLELQQMDPDDAIEHTRDAIEEEEEEAKTPFDDLVAAWASPSYDYVIHDNHIATVLRDMIIPDKEDISPANAAAAAADPGAAKAKLVSFLETFLAPVLEQTPDVGKSDWVSALADVLVDGFTVTDQDHIAKTVIKADLVPSFRTVDGLVPYCKLALALQARFTKPEDIGSWVRELVDGAREHFRSSLESHDNLLIENPATFAAGTKLCLSEEGIRDRIVAKINDPKCPSKDLATLLELLPELRDVIETARDARLAEEQAQQRDQQAAAKAALAARERLDRLTRLAVLEELVGGKPRPDPKSTRFPEAIHSNTSVQNFLRSDNLSYTWHCGGGINNARYMARDIGRYGSKYSAKATEGGTGRSAYVHIKKTTDYWRSQAVQHDKHLKELTDLRDTLGLGATDKRPLKAVDNEGHAPPAKKKKSRPGPPPKDADVIVIDD